MRPDPNKSRFQIIDDLKDASTGQFAQTRPGHWTYPLGVVIELNPSVCSEDEIREVENYLREELHKNRRAIRLQIVPEHPLEGEASVILGTQLSEDQPFHVRRQTFAEVFSNRLRREGFLAGDRLVRRLRVRFDKTIGEKITLHTVDVSFFRAMLENYSQDHTFYRIEEGITPTGRWYALSELEEVPVSLSGGAGRFEVMPFKICNSAHVIVHLEVSSLRFSTIKGVALLPGQSLRLRQKLDVEAVKRQIEFSLRQTNGYFVCSVSLPDSEFDLLPRQSIVFTPLSRPFRPRPKTLLVPSERERYRLTYVGARMRSLRTEIYVSDLFDSTFKPPMFMTVGHTQADRARWYAFNQPCDIQIEPTTEFWALAGYLFKAEFDQFRIRNIHLAFKPSHTDTSIGASSKCEILVEASQDETLVMVHGPRPVVILAFCEHDMPEIRLGQDRFQLRIARSYRTGASTATPTGLIPSGRTQRITGIDTVASSETSLNIRDGRAAENKPWRSIAFDEPFVVGHHILKVSIS